MRLKIVDGWTTVLIAALLASPASAQYNPRAPAINVNSEGHISFDPKVGLFATQQDSEQFIPQTPRNYLRVFPDSKIKPYIRTWNEFNASFFFDKEHFALSDRRRQNQLLQRLCRSDNRRWKIGARSNLGKLIEYNFGRRMGTPSPYFHLDCRVKLVWTCLPGIKCTGYFFIHNDIGVRLQFVRDFFNLTPILVADIRNLKIAPAGLRPSRD
jgi:hypothetical protein